MGNKNARKGSSDASTPTGSRLNIGSVSSQKNQSLPSSVIDTGSIGKDSSDIGEKIKDAVPELPEALENLPVQAPATPTSPELRFKSFKTGTLITNNGEPLLTAVPSLDHLLSPIKTRKNEKKSNLSGASPAFVPKTLKTPTGPKNRTVSSNKDLSRSERYRYGVGNYGKVQNLLDDMRRSSITRSPPTFGGYGRDYVHHTTPQRNPRYINHSNHGYSAPPLVYPYASHSPMGTTQIVSTAMGLGMRSISEGALIRGPPQGLVLSPNLPVKPPKVFMARSDKTKKDIVITATEAKRNCVQVTQRYLPDGMAYDRIEDIYDPKVYNFEEEFKALSDDEKKDFLYQNCIEISINIPDDYETCYRARETKTKVTKVTNQANKDGEETEEATKKYFKTLAAHNRTVLHTLKELGPDFGAYAKNVTVTLIFPRCSTSTPLNSAITLAPQEGAPVNSPTFQFLDALALYIDEHFISLLSLTVLLRVPSNTRMPLSMPQLYHVLPFYDLCFTAWEIKYQPDNLSMHLKVHGWAVGMLDRERDRVVVNRTRAAKEEQRQIDEAFFVRPSVFHPPVPALFSRFPVPNMGGRQ